MRLQKRYWIPASMVLLYFLVGFLAVGPVIRAVVLRKLPEVFHRDVRVERIAFNPIRLGVDIWGFAILEKDGGELVAFDHLWVNVAGLQWLRGLGGFDEIHLARPRVGIGIDREGGLSFADLLPSGPKPLRENDSPAMPVRIGQLAVTDGSLHFKDLSRGEPFDATLAPLNVSLTGFTTEMHGSSGYDFSARLGHMTMAWSGNVTARPFASKGQLRLEGLSLPSFAPYLKDFTQLQIPEGTASFQSHYAISVADKIPKVRIEDASLQFVALKVSTPESQLLQLANLTVDVQSLDLSERAMHIRSVSFSKPAVDVRRGADGTLEVLRFLGPPRRTKASNSASAPPSEQVSSWTLQLNRLDVQDGYVSWEDGALREPAPIVISQLEMTMEEILWPSRGPVPFSLSAQLGDSGRVRLKGPLQLAPLSAELSLETTHLPLSALNPYVREEVRAHLATGTLDLKGKLSVLPDILVQVDAAVEGFELREEGSSAAPLIRWKRVSAQQLSYSSAKTAVRSVDIQGLRIRLAKGEDGAMNLAQLMQAKAATGKHAGPPAPPASERTSQERSFELGTLSFSDVNVEYVDRSVAPAALTTLRAMGGSLQKIRFPKPALTQFQFGGNLNSGTFQLRGSILPAGKKSTADVTVVLADYELPVLAPYTVRYLAQPLEKGKLGMNLQWTLAEKRLKGENKLRVDQLSFGPTVAQPRPDATSLPLGLAIALLSDRHGRMDLDLPVMGNLDDPDFSYFSIILQALKNIVMKAATAPFSLLASLISGDPETLRGIAFEKGNATTLLSENDKVAHLKHILAERPSLAIELMGHVDPEQDRPALARTGLKAELTRANKGDDASYKKAVESLFHALKKAPPGKVAVPFQEMENDVLAARDVPAEAFVKLRRARANAIAMLLRDDGSIAAERVFQLEPPADSPASASVEVRLR